MAPRKGRKPAKNEQAAGLINALTFCAVIKPPTATSPPQSSYVWLNFGQAVAFDGIVAAGHPIDADIRGYPHAKLLLEALDNTDKTYNLTMRDDGSFEITSDKYQALVPSFDPTQVIPTPADPNQGPFTDGPAFLKALEAAGRVTTEAGDVALYSAVRLTGNGTVMATDGNIIVEAYHGNKTPPGLILPKQFVTSLLKTGKSPVGMGLQADWKTFTVWFEDGSWLRTAVYPMDVWPEEVTSGFFGLIDNHGEVTEIPPKLWTTLRALLPFTGDDNRVIIRPGLIRTHPDRRIGAALEVAEIPITIDVNGKQLLSIEPIATRYAVGTYAAGATLVFHGEQVRGVIAGLPALNEPEMPTETAAGGWDTAGALADAQGGWALAGPAPAPELEPLTGSWGTPATPCPACGALQGHMPTCPTLGRQLEGVPATGLAGDPEYESERQGIPIGPIDEVVTVEEALIYSDADLGIPLGGLLPPEEAQTEFSPSAWANSLQDVNE